MERAMIDGAYGKQSFTVLVQQVFDLSPAIEWVVLEEAGCEPRWVWRDPETSKLQLATTANNAQLIDPLLFMLAERSDNVSEEETITKPDRLVFVVLVYADIVPIVARMGGDAHVSAAASSAIDAYFLGTQLTSFLETYVHSPILD
jgi:hypothetical protein